MDKLKQLMRFGFSGAFGAALNIGILFVLTRFAGLWYLISAAIAFVVSYAVSFILQKYWTFKEKSAERAPVQAGMYLAVALTNLALNTGLMYMFVEHAQVQYLIAQALSSMLIAVESYFVYRYIFKPVPMV